MTRSYLGTQLLRATRNLFKRFKLFRYLVFKWSREESLDSHKYVVAKGNRIDRLLYSISCNFAWVEHQKLSSSAASKNNFIAWFSFKSIMIFFKNVTICHLIIFEKKWVYYPFFINTEISILRNTDQRKLAACQNGQNFIVVHMEIYTRLLTLFLPATSILNW